MAAKEQAKSQTAKEVGRATKSLTEEGGRVAQAVKKDVSATSSRAKPQFAKAARATQKGAEVIENAAKAAEEKVKRVANALEDSSKSSKSSGRLGTGRKS